MGDFSLVRVILRVSVLLVIIAIHYDGMFDFVFADNHCGDCGDIKVEPLWQVSGNDSCILNNLRPQEEKHVLFGSSYASCSVQVTASLSDHTFAAIDIPSTETNEDWFFLYYERIGSYPDCNSRYVRIVGQSKLCRVVFPQEEFLLHMQGSGSLVIDEIYDYEITNTQHDVICPELYHAGYMLQGIPACQNVTVYDQRYLCNSQFAAIVCQIDLVSEQCNHSVSLHEVVSHCLKEDRVQIIKQSMMVIPGNTLYLYLQFNNIVSLGGSPFYSLKYLQVLDLKSNHLTGLGAETFSGVDNLLELDVSSNKLSWLDGEVFHGLQSLYLLVLFDNKLALLHPDLFQDLRVLSRLELDDNLLARLPEGLFRNLGNLIEVYLYGNGLIEVRPDVFNGMISVRKIAMNSNELTTLPSEMFSGTKELRVLYLYENKLISLDEHLFVGLWNLIGLYVNSNELSGIPIHLFRNISLQELRMDVNKLETLDGTYFEGMRDMSYLYLNSNQLGVVSSNLFHGMRELMILHLFKNNLTEIATGLFHDLESLEVLLLHSNQLVSLDADAFIGLFKLNQLTLSENQLRSLPVGIFQDLQNLIELALFDNQLVTLSGELFHNLQSLLVLELQDNNLTMLTENLFSNMTSLQRLIIFSNKIVELNVNVFGGLKELSWLSMSHNQVAAVYDDIFKGLVSVYQLDFNYNLLITLPVGLFQEMVYLEQLSLNNNQLEALDVGVFRGLSWLRVLALSDNKLKELRGGTFASLVNLKQLYLYGNGLASLPSDVFRGLNNLKEMNLLNNSLSEIPDTAFANLTKLKVLDLTNNKLSHLGARIFQNCDLRYLIMAHNDLRSTDYLLKGMAKLKYLELSHNRLEDVPVLDQNVTSLEYMSLKQNPLVNVQAFSLDSLAFKLKLLVSQHEICECYVVGHVECSAANKRSPYLTCDRMLSDRVLMVMMWVIGVGAVIGNVFVLGWRQHSKVKNKVQGLLLSNLALSDFLMGVYMLMVASADIYYGKYFPMHSENWRSGITCRVAGALSIISSEASVFFVMLISIDRFICIRFPYSTRKFGLNMSVALCLITWLVSLVLGIAPSVLSGVNFKFYDNSHVCIGLPLALSKSYFVNDSISYLWPDESIYIWIPQEDFETEFLGEVNGLFYSTVVFFGVNFICYLVIVICYIEIVRAVQLSSQMSGRSRDMKEQITLTVKVSAIVATDFLCWFPIIILGILVQTHNVTLDPSVFAWLVTVALPINSAINPYLYTVTDIVANYRKKIADKKLKVSINEPFKKSTISGSVKTIETIAQKATCPLYWSCERPLETTSHHVTSPKDSCLIKTKRFGRNVTSCKQIVKPERCRHCKLCEKCRLNMDHHCLFLLGCVAKNNHRQFVIFIFIVLLAQVMFVVNGVLWLALMYPHGTWYDLSLLACQFQCWLLALMMLNLLSIFWGVNLLKFQLRVVSYGTTTVWKPHNCVHSRLTWSHRTRNVRNFLLGRRTYSADEIFSMRKI